MKLTGKMVSYNKGIVEIELPEDDARVICGALNALRDIYWEDTDRRVAYKTDRGDLVIINRLLGEDKPKETVSKKIEPLKDDWVTDDQCLDKLCQKVDEICGVLNSHINQEGKWTT